MSTTPAATSLAATSLTGLGNEKIDLSTDTGPPSHKAMFPDQLYPEKEGGHARGGRYSKEAARLRGLFVSGAEGARAHDLLAASQTLSQLSYSPKFVLPRP